MRYLLKPEALIAALCCVLFAASLAFAHHSNAMFDKSIVRHVSATVIEFQWTNPHIWIQISIEDEEGGTQEWSIESLGPNSLFRKGWRPNSFEVGDVIEIRFNPMRDGSAAGGFIGAKFQNGDTIGSWQVVKIVDRGSGLMDGNPNAVEARDGRERPSRDSKPIAAGSRSYDRLFSDPSL